MSDRTTAPRASGAASASSLRGDDWPTQTADTIERIVSSVRERTAEPVERLGRVVVYGILAAILGVAALVLGVIALVRLLDVVVPGEVWSAYLILGAISTVAGLVLWSKRTPDEADA